MVSPAFASASVSNLIFNHITGNGSFDYSGYSPDATNVTIQDQPTTYYYNYGSVSCSSSHCDFTGLGHGLGPFTCDPVDVSLWNGLVVADVYPLTNPDPSCVVSPTPTPTTPPVGGVALVEGAATDAISGAKDSLLGGIGNLLPIAAIILISVIIVYFVIRNFRKIAAGGDYGGEPEGWGTMTAGQKRQTVAEEMFKEGTISQEQLDQQNQIALTEADKHSLTGKG